MSKALADFSHIQIPPADLPEVIRKVLAAWKLVHADVEGLPEIFKQHGGTGMTQEEMAVQLTKLETDLSKANERADRLEVMSKLDDEDRAALESLPEAEQDAFFKADNVAKTDVLAKAKDAIAKREEKPEVPEEIRKQLVDIQKRLDEEVTKRQAAEEVAKKERDARELQDLTKRAETEFGQLPGTASEKGLVLKSLTKLTAEERTAVEKLLQSGNACLLQGMKAMGSDSVAKSGGGAWATIEKKAQGLVAEGKCKTIADGVTKVINEDPQLYQQYLKEQPARNVEE